MDEKGLTGALKKKLTKKQAITIMVVGGFMFLLAIVIPGEKPSTAYTIRIIVGFLGVAIAVVGAYLRPMGVPKEDK